MNILKQILLINLILFICTNCNFREENTVISDNKNEVVFKNWLKDTIQAINKEGKLDYNKEILVSNDSLSVDIIKIFDKVINTKTRDSIKSKEIIYVLDLLSRNNALNDKEFRLKLIMSSYYTVAMVNQLKYDYDSEIKSLEIIRKDSIERYKFVKGNLIEKDAKVLVHYY